jgi:hypothetical protein
LRAVETLNSFCVKMVLTTKMFDRRRQPEYASESCTLFSLNCHWNESNSFASFYDALMENQAKPFNPSSFGKLSLGLVVYRNSN